MNSPIARGACWSVRRRWCLPARRICMPVSTTRASRSSSTWRRMIRSFRRWGRPVGCRSTIPFSARRTSFAWMPKKLRCWRASKQLRRVPQPDASVVTCQLVSLLIAHLIRLYSSEADQWRNGRVHKPWSVLSPQERERLEGLFELAPQLRAAHLMREVLTAIFDQAQGKAQAQQWLENVMPVDQRRGHHRLRALSRHAP